MECSNQLKIPLGIETETTPFTGRIAFSCSNQLKIPLGIETSATLRQFRSAVRSNQLKIPLGIETSLKLASKSPLMNVPINLKSH